MKLVKMYGPLTQIFQPSSKTGLDKTEGNVALTYCKLKVNVFFLHLGNFKVPVYTELRLISFLQQNDVVCPTCH